MAYTSKSFLRDLAIYSTGAAVGAKNTGKFAAYAAKKGIQLAGVGAARAAPVVASTAAANPLVAGTALGLGALATQPGQQLLDAAAVRGAADRIAAQQAIDEAVFRATVLPGRGIETAVTSPVFKPAVKRKVSKYSKAVKAGMAAVKASTFGGKKGKISNAKKTFATVSKVASAVNKGKKVAKSGIRGVAARAIRRIL
jgi:hypothetical protein